MTTAVSGRVSQLPCHISQTRHTILPHTTVLFPARNLSILTQQQIHEVACFSSNRLSFLTTATRTARKRPSAARAPSGLPATVKMHYSPYRQTSCRHVRSHKKTIMGTDRRFDKRPERVSWATKGQGQGRVKQGLCLQDAEGHKP